MQPVVLHIPFHIAEDLHLRMLAHKRTLCDAVKDRVDVLITLDNCAVEANLAGLPVLDLRPDGPATGIVRATRAAIHWALEKHGPECWLARLGQDVEVDVPEFLSLVESLAGRGGGHILIGQKTYKANIADLLDSIGIHGSDGTELYVQGNFMCARATTWDKYYNQMPESVKHMRDDSLMSVLLARDGGELVFIEPFWQHHHGRTGSLYDIEQGIPHLIKSISSRYSDIQHLIPEFVELSKECESITEFRSALGFSTLTWLTHCKKVRSYGTEPWKMTAAVKKELPNVDFEFAVARSLDTAIALTDMLFIDSIHTYSHVLAELLKHCDMVKKYIVLHDTDIFGEQGEDRKSPALNQAIRDFLAKRPEWQIHKVLHQSHGCTILANTGRIAVRPQLSDALFLYRFHARSYYADKFCFLTRFCRHIEDLSKDFPSHLVLIVDNSPDPVLKSCEHTLGRWLRFFCDIVVVESEKLIGALPPGCIQSTNYYTFWQTSMELVKQYALPTSVIFFCEDDYVYRPDAFEKAIGLLRGRRADFVSLYDHPDRYTDGARRDEPKLCPPEIIWEASHHWRTAISTCLTFVATLDGLYANKDIFFEPPQRGDHDMWCEVWRRGRSRLWGAIPGLASHRLGPHLEAEWDE